MKNKLIISLFAALICTSGARADAPCITTTTDTPQGPIPSVARRYIENCMDVVYINYYHEGTASGTAVYSTPQCSSCNYGKLITFDNNGEANWTAECEQNNPTFTICAKPCTASCTYDTDWASDSDGFDELVEGFCIVDRKICEFTYSYRCASGYYGVASSDGKSGCTKCPLPQGYEQRYYIAASVPGEASLITDCFIRASDTTLNRFQDSAGTYKCTEDAYYKE